MPDATGSASAEVGGGTVGDFQVQLAAAASDRAATWEAVADVLAVPDAGRTERLRAGAHPAAWLRHCRWLGADSDILAGPATSLEAYARASRRRDAGDDLAALTADHTALVGPAGPSLAVSALAVADLCRAEAAAWSAGDMAGGKAARVDQRQIIDAEIVPALVPIAGRLATEAAAHVWRSLGRALLAVLSVETGTDHTDLSR
ncbi:hypothetical protein [Georgenia sunbinii]|uniref:hypothetical protein n=1 Tax=Georgenia sunbinii TaxID=3117728 RepID=UPI002F26C3EE